MHRPRFGIADIARRQQVFEQFVVRVEIPAAFVGKADEEALAEVLLVQCQAPFQLHLEEGVAVDVLGDEIGTLPVIREAHRGEAVIGEECRHFLEIVVFPLA